MSRKQQRRQRHRVEREVEEAWQALEDGERALAVRLSRRAREEGGVNPRVLLDCGRILLACGEHDDAEAALRESIRLAPNYADAFAALAELQAELHKMTAAIRLQKKVVELEPGNELAQRRLEEWRAATGASEGTDEPEAADGPHVGLPPPPSLVACAERLDASNLEGLAEAVVQQGWCALPALLTGGERSELTAAYDAASGLSQEFVVPYENRRVRYRWFLEPLPDLVAGLRAALWPFAKGLAVHQQTLLGRQATYPDSVEVWVAASRARGAREESVRLLRLEPGAALAPARAEDRGAFPLRAVADLGSPDAEPSAADATLVLTDQRPGRKVRRHRVATRPGDVVLFCGRDRLDRVGTAFGFQPVTFAFGPFAQGRLLLDLAFAGDG